MVMVKDGSLGTVPLPILHGTQSGREAKISRAGPSWIFSGGVKYSSRRKGVSRQTTKSKNELQKSKYRFEFNKDICLGCESCVSVCSIFHEGVIDGELARIRLNRHIFAIEYTVDFCRQCDHAECYYACPVDAIGADLKTGARVIDESVCTGCEMCVEACPFGIVSFWADRNVALKCDFCGGEPQCVKFCPTGALTLSNR